MKPIYTNVRKLGNYIVAREINEYNVRKRDKHPYQPTLFIPPKNKAEKTAFKSFDGQPLSPIKFDDIKSAKEFVERYKDITGFRIYGNDMFEYCYISDTYPDMIEWDIKSIKIAFLDIETKCEGGFPDPNTTLEEINAITLRFRNTIYLFGIGKFDTNDARIQYFDCADEKHLLEEFLAVWKRVLPDIVTGWNSQCFDMPYIYGRMVKVLGEKLAKSLSPWDFVIPKTVVVNRVEQLAYDIYGIAQLDYLRLYKKFTYINRDSYKLNNIAFVELGETKVSFMDEYDGYADFYTRNYQKFLEYNIQDVEIIVKLEQKLRLIELVVSMAYKAKVNFEDILSPVKTWDMMIFNNIRKDKIVIPFKKHTEKTEKFRGAFVKEPTPGLYRGVVSFDLNSLYPSIMRQFNISPEKFIDGEKIDVDVDELVTGEKDLSFLKEDDVIMAANGALFKRGGSGILPKMIADIYKDRVDAKTEMLEAKKKLALVREELKKRGK